MSGRRRVLWFQFSCYGHFLETPLKIVAVWDEDAHVWVADSEDVPGLIAEAEAIPALLAKLKVLIPDLLAENGQPQPAGTEIPFELAASIRAVTT